MGKGQRGRKGHPPQREPVPIAAGQAQRSAASDRRSGIPSTVLAAARCADCDSDVVLAAAVPGVYLADVLHDPTCFTWRRMAAGRYAPTDDRPPEATP